MYCPNCNEEHDGKFCPECGTKLIEKPSAASGASINLGDANAISGGIHMSDSHNVHNEDKSVHNITNVAAQKTDSQLLQERKAVFLNACKRAYEDNVLEQHEVVELEELRIKLSLDKAAADAILDSVRQMSERNARKSTLTPIARTRLKILTENLQKNEVKALMGQIDSLEPLVRRFDHDELSRKYFLVLAALKSERCIELYETSMVDSYWKSYWTYLAYIKLGKLTKAENVLISLDRFTEYPEDNVSVLAVAGALMMGNKADAKIYINELTGEHSPALQRFVDSLYLLLAPNTAKEMGADENTCAFYLVNFFGQKDPKAKAEEERLRQKAEKQAEAKRKAEAERKAKEEAARKAREETERKAKEEAARKAREEAERKAREEAERKAKEEAARKAREEAERKAKEEAARKAREEAERKAKEEAGRKAQQEAIQRELARQKQEADKKYTQWNQRQQQRQEAEAKRKEEEIAARIAAFDAEQKAEKEAKRKAEEAKSKAAEEKNRKARQLAERKKEAERKAKEEAKQKAAIKSHNGHDYVDLGLPSGTLWATCNIGASKPEDFGNYFAWGETSGYDEGKREFDDEHYKFRKKKGLLFTKWIFTKYVENKENGNVDNKLSLDKEDDAAYVQWGEGWRMPTTAQFEELINKDNTTQEFISKSGVKGLLITSKVNGICLFLPAADCFSYDWHVTKEELCHHAPDREMGDYWTRDRFSGPCKNLFGFSLHETRKDHDHCANSFSFFISSLDSGSLCCHISDNDHSGERRTHPTISRCFGYSIRPVRSK